jgi:hypothetical protein
MPCSLAKAVIAVTSCSLGGAGGGGKVADSAGRLAARTNSAKSPGVQMASQRAGPLDSTR